MVSTIALTDVEQEIATIRCLLAQQLHAIERHAQGGAEDRAADALLRRLLRRDEDLRARLRNAAALERID